MSDHVERGPAESSTDQEQDDLGPGFVPTTTGRRGQLDYRSMNERQSCNPHAPMHEERTANRHREWSSRGAQMTIDTSGYRLQLSHQLSPLDR